jgi:hypothetical protein
LSVGLLVGVDYGLGREGENRLRSLVMLSSKGRKGGWSCVFFGPMADFMPEADFVGWINLGCFGVFEVLENPMHERMM